MYLKHLDFDVPLLAIDDTSVAFTGKVVVGGTGEGMGGVGDGCPILGAKVCLKDKPLNGPEVQLACVDTDYKGEYSLPALIGTRVLVDVSYKNHTFVALASDEQGSFESGFAIKAGMDYSNKNLKDATTANLHVDVAGGLCNKLMGKATLTINVPGCEWTRDLEQVRSFLLQQNNFWIHRLNCSILIAECCQCHP